MILDTIPPMVDVERDSRGRAPKLRLMEHQGLGHAADDRQSGQTWEPTIGYLRNVLLEGHEVPLMYPLKLEVERTGDGSISVFSPVLNLGGVGATYRDAVSDLTDSLERLWLEFRDEPYEALHPSAQALRKKLSKVFAR